MSLLIIGCSSNDRSYHYKVLVYGYSFGERRDTSSFIAEEGEINSLGKILSKRQKDQLIKYTYNEKGSLTSKTEYQYEEDWKDEFIQGQIRRKENFEYDELDRIKRRFVYSGKEELITTNTLSYFGDTIIIEAGFGTDLSDKLIYQSVSSRLDDPSDKIYSKDPYWILTYLKNNQVVRVVLSKSSGSFFEKGIIEYVYDDKNRLINKIEKSGFDEPQNAISTDFKNLTWHDFKNTEPNSESKPLTPDIEEAWEFLTKPCEGKILTTKYYEYNELDSVVKSITEFGDVKILRKYSYPDKFTEVREFSGFPYDSDNGKSIFIYDKCRRLMSIEQFNIMEEPIEFKEYIYSN